MKTIGFIGTGVMGKSMAQNLINAGYEVHIYTRTKAKAETLLQAGATWHDHVASLAHVSDIVITIVGYPSDVEEVYFGSDGIIENAKAGSYLIDMTTSKPTLAKKIAETARQRQLTALDAPVSGGDIGAQKGSLAIMVGGDQTGFEAVLPIFEVIGEKIIYQGEAGAGQHTKMCNQIVIASGMIGVSESIAYAQKAGLDPSRVLESITTGAAGSWALSNLAPRIIQHDYAPGFYVKHFIKDMKIALETAQEMGLMTPGLELSLQLYQQLAEEGEENSGTQALIKLFQ
ncbi:3-hydroxyisobutyrate dehydrogenase [Natronobacillus azotifigens]|uniref:NAD(P)-dependent oxidoreductase n=1 Tax=Natronobacillus azotifigens TaxID=472978 RepID=A0A9J6RAK9_9BACI|nr:NAD(P)-dependent oxidoreductase [Natronobacillus azotifigens]MCZ0702714.1 NAD(P)-dependent oxidoreductase [Natronobacillus azotifigens]